MALRVAVQHGSTSARNMRPSPWCSAGMAAYTSGTTMDPCADCWCIRYVYKKIT